MTGRFKKALSEKKTPLWQRKEGKDPDGSLSVAGSKSAGVGRPVTKKPSKLKKGSKAAKRRKSFCARMGGMKKRLTSKKTASNPDSRINKALRKWNCSTDVNPNALQAMSEAVHFRVFESQIEERVISLIECAVNNIDQVTDEMIEDAFIVESILTPIVFEELVNPINESIEDFDEVIIRRFDEAINPANIRVPNRPTSGRSFRAGLKRGIYDAGAKVAKGVAGGAYNAVAQPTKDIAGATYQGVKNFYQGLSGDTPIGTRIGKTIRGGLSGIRRGFSKEGTPEGEGGGIGAAIGRGLRRGGRAIKGGITNAAKAYADSQKMPFGAPMERAPQKPKPPEEEVINQDKIDRNQRRKAADRKQGVVVDRATGRKMTPTIPTAGNPDAVRRARQSSQDIMKSAVSNAARASLDRKPTPRVPSDAAAQAANAPTLFRGKLAQRMNIDRGNLARARGRYFDFRNRLAKQHRPPLLKGSFTPPPSEPNTTSRSTYFPRPKIR